MVNFYDASSYGSVWTIPGKVLGLTSNTDNSNFSFLFRSKADYSILVYGFAAKTNLF